MLGDSQGERERNVDRTITILRAIGEVTRLRILAVLARGELTVSELVQVLGQSQPRVSRHMKLLTEAGVVERLPEGAWVFYRLAEDDAHVSTLAGAAVATLDEHDQDLLLRRDRERLDLVKAARAAAAESYFRNVARDWDHIRAMHQAEDLVEQAMLDAVGEGPFDLMIDVGTGTGRILQVFSDRIARGEGIDLSHDMLTMARNNLERAGVGHCSVRRADLYALPFADASADLVVVHQVLHYLDDPGLALSEAARILRPGGTMLVADFASHTVEELRDQFAHRRLGFSDEDVGDWMREAALERPQARDLAPKTDGLTVKLWVTQRPATDTAAPIAPSRAAQ